MSRELGREALVGLLALLMGVYSIWNPLQMSLGRWGLVFAFMFGARFGLAVQRVLSESRAAIEATIKENS